MTHEDDGSDDNDDDDDDDNDDDLSLFHSETLSEFWKPKVDLTSQVDIIIDFCL